MTLQNMLAAKGEAYSNIDIDRFPAFWREQKSKFRQCKIVQIIGTNGKGTTGRILAEFCHYKKLRVGHYTSPHLLTINERFWLNGANISTDILEKTHQIVSRKIGTEWTEQLSYFEYLTILAIELFSECDIAIIEAGLGGEYDATTVFDISLLLVTPIGLDHQHLLGQTITQIATTKLNAIKSPVIIAAKQPSSVKTIAKQITNARNQQLIFADNIAPSLKLFAADHAPNFLAINRQLSFAAAKFLRLVPVIEPFMTSPLFGRITQIAPNITVDVGHNIPAAKALKQAFGGKKVVLVYNSFADKSYGRVLGILKAIIKRVLILRVENPRIVKQEKLESALNRLCIDFDNFGEALNTNENYLVFGSFAVVEAFMQSYKKVDNAR